MQVEFSPKLNSIPKGTDLEEIGRWAIIYLLVGGSASIRMSLWSTEIIQEVLYSYNLIAIDLMQIPTLDKYSKRYTIRYITFVLLFNNILILELA